MPAWSLDSNSSAALRWRQVQSPSIPAVAAGDGVWGLRVGRTFPPTTADDDAEEEEEEEEPEEDEECCMLEGLCVGPSGKCPHSIDTLMEIIS